MAEGVCLVRAADLTIVYTNTQWDEMFGYAAGELLGQHISVVNAPGEQAPKATAEEIRRSLARDGRWKGEVLNIRKDGKTMWCSATVSTFEDPRHGRVHCAVQRDVTEVRAADRLRAEYPLATLEHLSPVGIFMADASGRCTWVNDQWCRLAGLTRAESRGDGWLNAVASADRQAVCAGWRRAVARSVPFSAELRLAQSGTAPIWAMIQRVPDLASDGTLVGYVGALTDITQRKQLELALQEREGQLRGTVREREVLLRELHHRVKNNLQFISSLLTLQLGQLHDARLRTLVVESRNRIRAMATVHECLYRNDPADNVDMQTYLETVANSALMASRPASCEVALSLDIEPIRLDFEVAVRCGLSVNELVSNCGKHAFRGCHTGRVLLALRRDGAHAVLTVSDDGVGLPERIAVESADTVGLQLVVGFARQLGGDLRILDRRTAAFRVRFPLPERENGGSSGAPSDDR